MREVSPCTATVRHVKVVEEAAFPGRAVDLQETLEVCGGNLSDAGMGHPAAVASLIRLSLLFITSHFDT